MPNPEHLAKLKEGVEVWNAWKEENEGVQVDLSGADLTGAILYGAKLVAADLIGADLRGADLIGADLRGAELTGANHYGANLYGANLCEANVEKARLYETVFAIYRHSLQGQCASVGSNLTTGVKPPWRPSIAR